jgi:hypothetical protein
MQITFDSADELARSIRRAGDAYGSREDKGGQSAWPEWFALFLEREQSGPLLGGAPSTRLESPAVLVAIVTSRAEAELIAGMLRDNDLSAVVSTDDAGGQDPALQVQGVRVLTVASDAPAAIRLLAAAQGSASAPKGAHR